MLFKTLNITNNIPEDGNGGFIMISSLMDTLQMFLREITLIYFHPCYFSKAPLSQSKHTFAYTDKDVEVIHQTTKMSPEFHMTNIFKGRV